MKYSCQLSADATTQRIGNIRHAFIEASELDSIKVTLDLADS